MTTKKNLTIIPGITITNDLVIYDPYVLNSSQVKQMYQGYKILAVRRPSWGKYNKDMTPEVSYESSTG
jgi:hypothetical protein